MKEIIEYLPIGTIFLEKDNIVMHMIIGYLYKEDKDKKIDYITIPFPHGLMTTNILNYFTHKDIDEVIFCGYKNDKFQELKNVLNHVEEKK